MFLLLAVLLPLVASAKTIQKAEYFFNNDPGFGNGTPIEVSAEASLELDLAIAIPDTLPDGINTLYLRFQDSEQHWSLTHSRAFIKYGASIEGSKIDHIEYFFDSDPGFGLGHSLPVEEASGEVLIDFNIDMSGLEKGFHTLYIRPRNKYGQWGISTTRVFYLRETASAHDVLIDYVEYFIDTDPGYGNGISVPFTPAVSISELDFEADISGLSMGEHTLHVRAKNTNEVWSAPYSKVFSVCNLAAPIISEVADITATGFKIIWNEVPGATSYIVEVSKDDFTTFSTVTVPDTDATGTNWERNTTLQARVRAVGECTSENSNIVSFTTKSCDIPPKPVITLSNNHTEAVALVSSSSFGNEWYRNGTLLESEEPGNILMVTEPGVYKVQVVDGECVSEFSDEVVIVISALGDALPGGITLYPNPAKDRVTIAGPDNIMDYKLTDAAGREQRIVFRSEGGQYSANVQHLSPGAYLLFLNDGSSHKYIRFFKK